MYDHTERHLAELEQRTAELAYTLVRDARLAGVPLVIVSGLRSALLNRDVGGGERSLHLQGLAFDVGIWPHWLTRSAIDRIPLDWWLPLAEYAEELGLYWGGRFLHAGRPDANHFDLRRFGA